ncbi:MAG: aldo/keto reductase [Pseudomonadota bacterium]
MTTVGSSNLTLPPLGLGTAPIGGLHADTSDDDSRAVLEQAWQEGIRYFDTAPWYGNTQSEHRLGAFLRKQPRDDFVVATKVGRLYRRPERDFDFEASAWRQRWPGGLPFVPHFDYSYDQILRSYEDSLARLGLNRVDALTIHDLDIRHQKTEEAIARGFEQLSEGGGFKALEELKRSGEIRAIGAGINLPGYIPRFLERFDLDYFLLAMPYTLIGQEALAEELPLCQQRGASVIIGAPFASGILATGAVEGATYRYVAAPQQILDKVARIEAVCASFDVPLTAAALQFPLGHETVVSVIPGADGPAHVSANVAATGHPIPAAFWSELKAQGLIDPDAPVPS